MAAIPESTKSSLRQRLEVRRRERWPALGKLSVTFRVGFAYVAGDDADGDPMPLFRLRYQRSASSWGFAIYLASRDGYEDSILPSGAFAGTPEEALDCACGLYLNDPSAWAEDSPRNF
ncbi:MAG TPA: hypothetical protein VMV08_11415 [Gaiellaceae bacterium]|nr:hypothetical protein [Gaiellaceae bacterium]